MPNFERVLICGVPVANLTCLAIERTITTFLQEKGAHQIATINPEFLYRAAHDPVFQDVLTTADLHVIDGFGVSCAFIWHRRRVQCRMTGVELMWQLLDRANRDRHSVFLATNAFGLTQWIEMRDVIHARYPHVRIDGADMDPHAAQIGHDTTADIILCNFGAPYQEIFIRKLKDRGACVIGVGVGGAFDFATGKIARAPRWMRRCGCEWLWRLIHQPRRWRRIMRAVIFFPFYVVFGK